MKKIVNIVLVFILSACVFTGCGVRTRTLYRSNTVEIVHNGAETAVFDLLNSEVYTYTTKRVKRSENHLKAYTSVDTDIVKVDILETGLQVTDKKANTVFTISRKKRQ